MTDVFSAAFDTLYADENMSRAATYTPPGGAATDVRVLIIPPKKQLLDMGRGRSGGAVTVSYEVRKSEIPAEPEREAVLVVHEVAGDVRYIVESSANAGDGYAWSLDVRPL